MISHLMLERILLIAAALSARSVPSAAFATSPCPALLPSPRRPTASIHRNLLLKLQEEEDPRPASLDSNVPNLDQASRGPGPYDAPATRWMSLSERTKGLLVLLTVPIAWGTYVPVVRYLYAIQPAVPGFVFSASYYAVASLTTLSIVAIQEQRTHDNTDETSSSPFPILGGIELGFYLFIANCLQVIGLKTVPSDRAGFLVQLTTVMVPVLEAMLAGNLLAVSSRTWFSCILAFIGICVMNLDGLARASASSLATAFTTFTQGDVLILAAAVLYTVHVVRLGRYAKETTPMKLAASKATVETLLSTGLVFGLMSMAASGAASSIGLLSFVQETGTEIATFFSTITKSIAAGTVPKSTILSAVGATLWTGLVTCAYAIVAQSFGQRRVGPTDSNLIYSIQPLCTAMFAFLLLGETMGPAGIVGGAFIGAAVYLVSVGGDADCKEEKDALLDLVPTSGLEPELDRLLQRNTTYVLIKQ